MPDQLVRERAADARDDEVEDRVFEDRAVPDLQDVADVRRVAPGARARVRGVAEPARTSTSFCPATSVSVVQRSDALVGQETGQLPSSISWRPTR
jgi:hypothetical protein